MALAVGLTAVAVDVEDATCDVRLLVEAALLLEAAASFCSSSLSTSIGLAPMPASSLSSLLVDLVGKRVLETMSPEVILDSV